MAVRVCGVFRILLGTTPTYLYGNSMATDYDYDQTPPKKVKQTSTDSCWAAAFECILDAIGASNKKTEKELVATYGQTSSGGITPEQLSKIAKDFGFVFNVFWNKADAAVFSDKFVMGQLKSVGPILAAPKITTSTPIFFHAQVIWGVHYMTVGDIGTKNALMYTMNPDGGKYSLYQISYFQDNLPMFTCWKNKGS